MRAIVPRLLLALALCLAAAGVGATAAGAHPLGNFTTNQLVQVKIDRDRALVHYVLDRAEIPTFQTLQQRGASSSTDLDATGRTGNVGSLVTKTLLVSGEAGFGPTSTGERGAMLRAYDKATGKEVGAVYMPAPQSGSPMTYMLNGKQYIVVAVSGSGFPGELIAYKLP